MQQTSGETWAILKSGERSQEWCGCNFAAKLYPSSYLGEKSVISVWPLKWQLASLIFNLKTSFCGAISSTWAYSKNHGLGRCTCHQTIKDYHIILRHVEHWRVAKVRRVVIGLMANYAWKTKRHIHMFWL